MAFPPKLDKYKNSFAFPPAGNTLLLQVLYDLGCGDGRICIEAAESRGARACGECGRERFGRWKCLLLDAGSAKRLGGEAGLAPPGLHSCRKSLLSLISWEQETPLLSSQARTFATVTEAISTTPK